MADGKLGQGWDLETNVIGSMDGLYRSARLVLILLEDIQLSNECEDEHNLIRRLQVKDYYCSVDTEAQALARAFAKVLSARWFSRSWCSQEYILCKEYLFLVPLAPGYLTITSYDISWLFAAASRCMFWDGPTKVEWKRFRIFTSKYHIRRPLMDLFRATAELDSFYFRDRIYGHLSEHIRHWSVLQR